MNINYLFPFISSIKVEKVNRSIFKEYELISKDSSIIKDKMALVEKNYDKEDVPRAIDELYNFEIQRKSTIESKATSLFGSAAIAVSVIALLVTFWEYTPFDKLLISSLAAYIIINFILSAVYSFKILQLTMFNCLTTDNLIKFGDSNRIGIQLILDKFRAIELNYRLILTKSNRLVASENHFMAGVVFLVVLVLYI